MCCTLRPRSRTSVFKPFSHSSFAAQPPEMPEPMTMASKVFGWLTGLTYGAAAAWASVVEGTLGIVSVEVDTGLTWRWRRRSTPSLTSAGAPLGHHRRQILDHHHARRRIRPDEHEALAVRRDVEVPVR